MNAFAKAFTACYLVLMSNIRQVAKRANISLTTMSHIINHADRKSKMFQMLLERRNDGYLGPARMEVIPCESHIGDTA